MTTWKARMLDELFLRERRAALGQLADATRRMRVCAREVKELWGARKRARARSTSSSTRCPSATCCRTRPRRSWSTRASRSARASSRCPPRSCLRAHPDVVELCVVTDSRPNARLCVVAGDRPGLLAAIAAAISANRLEIHAAQVTLAPCATAACRRWICSGCTCRRREGACASGLPKLERDLHDVVTGKIRPSELLKRAALGRWSERASPPVLTEVVIDHRASQRHTVIEVLTQDRPGLLFTLAQALHALGLTITLAKINTEGTRVIDVFYVTDADGRKLAQGEASERVRAKLAGVLGASHKAPSAGISAPGSPVPPPPPAVPSRMPPEASPPAVPPASRPPPGLPPGSTPIPAS